MRRHTHPRLLSGRTIGAAVAAAGVLAVAIYATNANTGTSQPIQARAAAVEQVDQAVQAGTGLPFDIQGLIGQAQQLAGDDVSLADLIQRFKDLLRKFGIDPSGIQQFLDQLTEEMSPQQLTDDAKNFLVQQGVAAADIEELRAEVNQVLVPPQQVPPDLITRIIGTLARLAKQYWLGALIIVAVAVALVIFGSRAQQPKNKSRKNGPGCGLDATTLDGYLVTIPRTGQPTTGIGFDIPAQGMNIKITSGQSQDQGTGYNGAPDYNLHQKGRAWLTKKNENLGTTDHAETKMATYMRLIGDDMWTAGQKAVFDNSCMVINNSGGPCDLDKSQKTGCIYTAPVLLSDQWKQALTVNWKAPDGKWYHVDLTNTATNARPDAPATQPSMSQSGGPAVGGEGHVNVQ